MNAIIEPKKMENYEEKRSKRPKKTQQVRYFRNKIHITAGAGVFVYDRSIKLVDVA